MEHIQSVEIFLWFFCFLGVDAESEEGLICPGRKYNLSLECGVHAAMTVEVAVAGFVVTDEKSCNSTDEKEVLINTAAKNCIVDQLKALERCQGQQICSVDCKQGIQPLSFCKQSPKTNVLYVRYSCYRNAIVYVAVGGSITFLVVLVFIVFTIRLGRERKKKQSEKMSETKPAEPIIDVYEMMPRHRAPPPGSKHHNKTTPGREHRGMNPGTRGRGGEPETYPQDRLRGKNIRQNDRSAKV